MTRFYIGREEVTREIYAQHLARFGVKLEPRLLEKARNLGAAAIRAGKAFLRGKPVIVSNEEQARRMAICCQCEFFTGSTCQKCGCHIRFKAKLQTEHCPIGKW